MQSSLIPLHLPIELGYAYDDEGNIRDSQNDIVLPESLNAGDTVAVYLSISEVCRTFYTLSLAWNGRFAFSRTPKVKMDMFDYKVKPLTTIVQTVPLWALQTHLLFLHPKTTQYLSFLHQELNWRYYEDIGGTRDEIKEKEKDAEKNYENDVIKYIKTTLDYFQFISDHVNIPLKYPYFISSCSIPSYVQERIYYDIIGKCKGVLEDLL